MAKSPSLEENLFQAEGVPREYPGHDLSSSMSGLLDAHGKVMRDQAPKDTRVKTGLLVFLIVYIFFQGNRDPPRHLKPRADMIKFTSWTDRPGNRERLLH